MQIFKCKDCKRKFTTNFGFEKKQNEEYIITGSLEMYFSGMSVRDISRQYHAFNVGINSKRSGRKIHPTNNMMERLNGEIRDREKVFRGLKKKDTPLIQGLKLWYNFSKEHGGLGGDVTPSEAALIKVDGDNTWKTIIQNASLNRDYE